MPKKPTTNITLHSLKDTPFKSAGDRKREEQRITNEEWESVARARARRRLLLKDENREILSPFFNGFQAKFVGRDESENVVKVYLTKEEQVQIEVDSEMKDNNANEAIEGLVKSISESFMNGYLTALGLKEENLFKAASKKPLKKS